MRTDRTTIFTLLLLLAATTGGLVYVVWNNHDQFSSQASTISGLQQNVDTLLADREADRRLIAALQAQVRLLCGGRPNCQPITVAPASPRPAPAPTVIVTVIPAPGSTNSPTGAPRPTDTPAPRPTTSRTPTPTPTPSCTRVHVGPVCA